MSETRYSLNQPMVIVTALWMCAHDHKDMDSPLKLSTLVQCYRELGILRGKPDAIWRALNRTRIPATFPLREVSKWGLVVVALLCTSSHWEESANAWIEANRPLLIEKQALKPDVEPYRLGWVTA